MLTPEELAAINEYIRSLYEEFEDATLHDIARRLMKTGEITEGAAIQALRLSELGASSDEMIRRVAQFTRLTEHGVETLFRDVAERSVQFDKSVIDRLGKKPVGVADNMYLQQLYKATLEQTEKELRNISQSMGFLMPDGRFSPLADTYQRALDAAELEIASGTSDYNTAIRRATQKLAASGITTVDYQTGYVSRADVAARRAVLTGIGQVTGEISEANADALGTDYWEVTAHTGARPDHAAWQGKVYKMNGSEDGYPNLAEATGYGTGAGLKGWNCRHDMFPFFPGVSERLYTDEELEHIDPPPFAYEGKTYTAYEATQQQRKLETSMRTCKRKLIAADETGDDGAFTEQSIRLRRLKEYYKDFSSKAGLPLQADRAQVLGYGHSISGKAVWEARYARANFSSEAELQRHIVKHLTEYGNISVDEYVNKARNLLRSAPSDDILQMWRSDGSLSRYRISTNEFVVGTKTGKIRTAFKPLKGIDYWREEVERNG